MVFVIIQFQVFGSSGLASMKRSSNSVKCPVLIAPAYYYFPQSSTLSYAVASLPPPKSWHPKSADYLPDDIIQS